MSTVNPGNRDPINSINTYKQLAKNDLQNLNAKQVKSSQDKDVINVLKKEIHNLDQEQKRLESAQKVDGVFVRFLKLLGWTVTAPIWVIPYAIKKLFVREQSTEERIQNSANRILNHINPKPIFDAVVKKVQSYGGEIVQDHKDDVVRLIFGISKQGGASDNLKYDDNFTLVKHQFWMDQKRTSSIKIGEAIDNQDIYTPSREVEVDIEKVALRRFEKLQGLLGEKELSIVSSFLSQAMIGDVNQEAYSKLGLYDENMNPNSDLDTLFQTGYLNGVVLRQANFTDPEKVNMTVIVEDGKIYVSYEQAFDVVATGSGVDGDGRKLGYITVKRDVIIPKEELVAVYDWMQSRESDTAMNPSLMPNLKVIDSYSPVSSQ